MTATRVCFVGLPEAGKTTFLAAFWATCRHAGNHEPTFEIVRFPGPAARRYLQEIGDAWFEGRKVGRNTSGSWEPVELTLRTPSGQELDLVVPDLSGEAFRDVAAVRQIEQRVADLVAASTLLVFFVNAATASAHMSLADFAPGAEQAQRLVVEFDAKELETDILNAELLQLLPMLTECSESPPPVAVVVSAWDTVDSLGVTPAQWLETNQPMFSQVLDEYARSAVVTVIGISAQGGDYDRDHGVTAKPPHDRPLVVTATARSTDIGAPFTWFARLPGSTDGG